MIPTWMSKSEIRSLNLSYFLTINSGSLKIIPIFIAKSETMDKYLLQILLQTKTIIIPGLGALTITNEDTGEIMFMSYLKYDDGELVKHIVEKDGYTENDAKNLIAKYVSEIKSRLNQGNDYEMFQFGRFFLKDGEIEFENWRAAEDLNSTSSTSEVEEVIESEENVETPEEIIAAPVVEIVEVSEVLIADAEPTEIHEAEKSLDEILKETEEVEDEDLTVEEKEAEVTDFVETTVSKENSYTPLKETLVVEDIIEVPAEEKIIIPAEPEPIIDFQDPVEPKVIVVKKKRKPFFWILIFLILLLLGLGLATILFYDQVKQYLPFMENQRTEVERKKGNAEEISDELNESAEVYENGAKTENNQTEGTAIEEPVLEPKVEEIETKAVVPAKEVAPVVKTTLPTGKHYFVIAGAFGEKSNADRYADKLTSAGNQSSIIGQYDGLYLVAIDSYDSEAEAEQAVSKFSDITTKAWVFHKR